MSNSADRLAAIVAVGAVMPDAPNVAGFWRNILDGKSSISEVPADRWNADAYYDPDPRAPDKTYSKIGGWVRDLEWNPLGWKLPIPPRVSAAMDLTQRMAIVAAREALADYGKPLDGERTAVILGNAMGGDAHLLSAARILLPEFSEELATAASFKQLPQDVQRLVLNEVKEAVRRRVPDITEDTMPGELSNIAAGRIAALYDFKGPNFITDAACASAMAAMNAAVQGLIEKNYDAVVTGGVDSNMSPSGFVKFAKIGALSATGSRPYAEGADGFVMGEGAACFLLKRLADAERDGDRVYAVIRGIGSSSDGKGKGITAPNPVGQRLAVGRGWQNAGVRPEAGDLIEGHGTSTKVGDVVEVNSLSEVLLSANVPAQSIALGSVKSNFGHLKGAAGAAGVLKAALALHHKIVPPSINFRKPNPDIDFAKSAFYVNTEKREWVKNGSSDGVRRAGVSAFGFGGTNFHVVLEQHVPGMHRRTMVPVEAELTSEIKAPLRGALVVGGKSESDIAARLRHIAAKAAEGEAPATGAPAKSDLSAPLRVAIDYANATELAELAMRAVEALDAHDEGRWKALRNKGVYFGKGAPGKIAFLFTGQGSQYVNMLRELSAVEPIVKRTYDEADAVMQPLIGSGITQHIFLDKNDEAALARAEEALKQTAITQPAVLTVETALARLLGAYGVKPDFVMGHSLGEYGALIAAGALTFGDALRAVSARGEAMTHLSLKDQGTMAAVFGAPERVQQVLATVPGYVVVANLNSTKECVIGGATDAMEAAIEALKAANIRVQQLSVSHAFHTDIVAPAAEPLRSVLRTLDIHEAHTRIVANVTGEFYPDLNGDAKEHVVDMLGKQVGSPVQFVKGLNTLYNSGARVFVEVGPKRALFGLVEDVLGDNADVTAIYTNHPRLGDVVSLNRALCGLYALGLGAGTDEVTTVRRDDVTTERRDDVTPSLLPARSDDKYVALGKLFTEFLDKSYSIYSGGGSAPVKKVRVGISGAAVGLPGTEKVFDDQNIARIFAGQQLIKPISQALRESMATRGIVRLVKGVDGAGSFEVIDDTEHVIKLAAKAGEFDLVREYGYSEDRLPALDRVTQLAIAAGIDALRDAGIPLVQRYKTTTTGSRLPVGWSLPASMRDDTGIIFASAYPGLNQFSAILRTYYENQIRLERLDALRSLRASVAYTDTRVLEEIDERIAELEEAVQENPYHFDRRFLFQVLNFGHAQFAEYIGARGPNIGTNGACSSGAQAISLAKDWVENGRCRRVIVISADDVTSDELFPWFGSGFLASGVGATDARVEDAAIPFDRRRHGMIVGMGGAALVVEAIDAAEERGLQPICEMLGSVIANSAYHGSRLDVQHIVEVMEKLVSGVEQEWQISRSEIARDAVFVSHETYTPARGGSASAEVAALRKVFGSDAGRLIIANTKGYTGHPMATALEDALAVKMLETGVIPPVPNYREVDPDLGSLNLSKGGSQPVTYALRLGAGFGSQISMTLTRWLPAPDGARRSPTELGFQHRIKDKAAWQRFLQEISGNAGAELEIVQRTLRVKNGFDAGAIAPAPVPVQPAAVVVEDVPVPPAAPSSNAEEAVAQKIIEIVSKQTGYPTDMLALDLDLEADLGIDTVKQAEMFAAIRAEYNIERDENIALRDYPTLQHAIEFVYAKRPELRVATPAAAIATAAPVRRSSEDVSVVRTGPSSNAEEAVANTIIAIVSRQTGYPADMLALDLDLEADLGIDTVKQAEMFAAIRAEYSIERDENIALRDYPTLQHAIEFVYAKRPDLRVTAAAAPVSSSGEDVAVVQTDTSSNAEEAVANTIIAIVSKQTGYPADMLALDLDLEADLGIDTVKQAEMFAAIRAEYNIERDENIALRDYPTLKHAIQFVFEKRPDLKSGPVAEASVEPDVAAASALITETQIKRRVPTVELRPPCTFFANTNAGLTQGSRVLVVPDKGGVAKELTKQLGQLGVDVVSTVDGKIDGVYWLPALDTVSHDQLLDASKRKQAVDARVKQLYATARALYDQQHFLVSATRLGGDHGYETGSCDELGGAVTGFTKAFSREKPNALAKAVDFETGASAADIAAALIAETVFDAGVVEVGYQAGVRRQVSLSEVPVELQPLELGEDSVFVVTGAAGSITSAIIADLAKATRGTFWLLDLTPEPDASDSKLQRVQTDRDNLKKEIFAQLQQTVERATPAMVEKEIARLERARAALDAISAVTRVGGKVQYRSVDLRDAAAVQAITKEITAAHKTIDVLIHAAGLEISRSLPDKKPEEFDLVFDVKTEGWFNVIGGLETRPIGAIVAFSSIAGRFGNAGQTDYSSANDLLCKSLSAFHRTHPATRTIAIDWTAWADIGMASRGSIPTIMKAAGIDMLPPSEGIPAVRRELASGRSGEVVVAGSLGAMVKERGDNAVRVSDAPAVLAGANVTFGLYDGLCVEVTLDPAREPFLFDHQINGVPVLPGVMALELMAEAATLPFGDRFVSGFADVDFMAPFKFYRGEARALKVMVQFSEREGVINAACRLIGERVLHGRSEPEVTLHFTATVALARKAPRAKKRTAPMPADEVVSASDIYRVYFHGPSYQVLDSAWRSNGNLVGSIKPDLPPDHTAEQLPLLIGPRLIELAFQTAGLAEMSQAERMGLPYHIDRLDLYTNTPELRAGAMASVVVPQGENGFDIEVCDAAGKLLMVLRGYRTSALPETVDASAFAVLK